MAERNTLNIFILKLKLTLELSQIHEVLSVYSELLFIFARNNFLFESILSTQDPARDGGNWYGYCGQNPVTFQDPNGLFAYGPDGQQYSTISKESEQSPSNVSNFVNGVVTGFNNSFNALSNLDFGKDCGQNAWNSFSNGDILGGIAWELNGMTEVVVDFGLALTGAGVLGAGIASAGTLFTTGSTTAAYVSWQYNLQNNLGIVNSNIQSGWNQFCSNTGISDLTNKVKTISFNIKYFHSDGSPRWPKRDGFKGKVLDVTLEPGTIIDRYGYDTGTFVSPYGTSYTQRALPPGTNLKPYSVFEVVKPVNVKSGEVKPWFGEEGHGIQYMFNQPISKLLENGTLRRIEY